MGKLLIERRLGEVTDELRRLRAELAVNDEQAGVLNDMAEETRLRSLVSETPIAGREHTEAQRHADAMTRAQTDIHVRIAKLERTQDELLDRLVAATRPS